MSVERVVTTVAVVKALEVNWVRNLFGYWFLFTLIAILWKWPFILRGWFAIPVAIIDTVLHILLLPFYLVTEWKSLINWSWMKNYPISDADWVAFNITNVTSGTQNVFFWVFLGLGTIAFFNWVATFSSDHYSTDRGQSLTFMSIFGGLAYWIG